VYVVLDGTATFHIDGETFDAPAGTFVSVPPESRRKATGDGRRATQPFSPSAALPARCTRRFREQARADDDFAAVRDDPRFEEALR